MIAVVLRIYSNLNHSNDEITYIPLQFPKFFVFYLASILNELPEGPIIIVQTWYYETSIAWLPSRTVCITSACATEDGGMWHGAWGKGGQVITVAFSQLCHRF